MKLLLKILINAAGLLLIPFLLGNSVQISSYSTAIIVVVVLALLNVVIRPILFILTLPVNVLTLGLFRFVINGFIFWLASFLVPGFKVTGILTAILGALIMSGINMLADAVVKGGSSLRAGGVKGDEDNFPKPGEKVRDI